MAKAEADAMAKVEYMAKAEEADSKSGGYGKGRGG